MRVFLLSLLLACRPAPPTEDRALPVAGVQPTESVAPSRPAQPLPKADVPSLLERITWVHSLDDVWLDRERALCGELGRASIPPERSAALGPLAPGSTLWVVHPGGTAALRIEDVRCDTPAEYAPAYFRAAVTWPKDVPALAEDRPYLLFHERTPDRGARLRAPTPIDPARRQELAPAIRRHLEAAAAELTDDMCTDVKGRGKVGEDIEVFDVAPDRIWVTAELELDEDCTTVAHTAGLLLSADGARRDLSFASNGGVDLVWLVDLDGDGREEAVVNAVRLEDDYVTRSIASCDRETCKAYTPGD